MKNKKNNYLKDYVENRLKLNYKDLKRRKKLKKIADTLSYKYYLMIRSILDIIDNLFITVFSKSKDKALKK
jgi:hypothetical protein